MSTAAALAAVLCLGPLAVPALAKDGTIYPDGRDGCAVAWSYGPGTSSTTVYYNNHCNRTIRLRLTYEVLGPPSYPPNHVTVHCYIAAPKKTKDNKKVNFIVKGLDGKATDKKC
ncbi:hypothetical protein [Allokutzneria albata]|uniref:hypothetical protein n=1 Tax=Allokutzneria albata TaxID=211114 RepID=UPI0009F362B7|nr:hypothetical protein [Allokutzneria albata]